MSSNEWTFSEDQRADVCNGKLCPKCGGTDIKAVGANPDGYNMNIAYDCKSPNCGEKWEGY